MGDGIQLASAAEEQEETGWKYIHGDVFRPPYQLNLFSACVGTGTQILAMAVAIFALALVGVFYPYNRGALLTACVVSSPPLHVALLTSAHSTVETIPSVALENLQSQGFACSLRNR